MRAPRGRSSSRAAALLLVCLALAVGAVGEAASKPRIAAAEILRRAESVRSPELDYAVDFTIGVVDDYSPGVERRAAYTMAAHGKNHSMVLMRTPESFYGGTLLIKDGDYWLLLPMSTRALQLTAEQIFKGDVANGDLARVNLQTDYEPSIEAEEVLDGDRCWRLVLMPRGKEPRYSKIRLWVAKKQYLPKKFEYYGKTGAYLKEARYLDYRKTPLGVRSMRLEVDNPEERGRRSTMVFTNLRKIDTSPLTYTPEGMVRFRDAARARRTTGGPDPTLEDILGHIAGDKK